jgi:hypothetical protein
MIGSRGQTAGLALLFVLGVCGALGGCGGSSAAEQPSTNTTPHHTAEFADPAGGTPYTHIGREATEAEREAASRVIERNFRARAEGDWHVQCATLSAESLKRLAGDGSGDEVQRCAAELKRSAQPLSSSRKFRANTLPGEIDALRVEGSKGYAMYHGNDGQDYGVPMRLEGGEWRVDSLISTPLNPPSGPSAG